MYKPAELAGRETGALPHHPVLGRPGDLVQRREEPVLGRALEVPRGAWGWIHWLSDIMTVTR